MVELGPSDKAWTKYMRAYQGRVDSGPLPAIPNRRNIDDKECLGKVPHGTLLVMRCKNYPPGAQDFSQCELGSSASVLEAGDGDDLRETEV